MVSIKNFQYDTEQKNCDSKCFNARKHLLCEDTNKKKSYGEHAWPVVFCFEGNKSHCQCHVGASGLCFHILAAVLFLQHFSTTKEKLLELTCIQKLQKWHRRSFL